MEAGTIVLEPTVGFMVAGCARLLEGYSSSDEVCASWLMFIPSIKHNGSGKARCVQVFNIDSGKKEKRKGNTRIYRENYHPVMK